MKALRHIVTIAALLGAFLVAPALIWGDFTALMSGVDAVSRASMEIPDQPSGNYVVLLNTDLHPKTVGQWTDFFTEAPVGVIMEDISCVVCDADVTGGQLAQRYQARLATNQMDLRRENGLLTVSKAQYGKFDVIIFSQEMADAYSLGNLASNVAVISVVGEGA